MNKLWMVLVLTLCCGMLYAEDEAPKPADDGPVEVQEVPADFTDYIRRVFPDIDPGGKHNIYSIRDFPNNPDERHAYTMSMTRLVLLYLVHLDMGPMMSKLFDQHSRGRYGEMPTFKVLHAVVLIHYPPGQPNLTHARTLLQEAAAKAADYAYPWFYLSQLERVLGKGESNAPIEHLDRALAIRPTFTQAAAMKAEMLLRSRPPRIPQAREQLERVLQQGIPDDPDDYQDLLLMHAEIMGAEAFHELVSKHLGRDDLGARFRVRALITQAQVHMAEASGSRAIPKTREAIAVLETALEHVSLRQDPRVAIQLHHNIAVCWGGIAMDLRRRNPDLSGVEQEFDQARRAARRHHEQAAEIERTHTPIAMRGPQARNFVMALANSFQDFDFARRWLETYLDETDLTVVQRTTLENLLAEIKLRLDPSEEARLDLIEGYISQDEAESLTESLRDARSRVRLQHERFKTARALRIFISLLKHRERAIVRDAAFLAAITANELGGEAVAQAAVAIADRFLEEIECNTRNQAELQQDLCESLKLLDHLASHVRMIRHLAKLVEAAERTNWVHANPIVHVWNDREYLRSLKPAMSPPTRMALGTATRAAEWLRSVADHIDRQLSREQDE